MDLRRSRAHDVADHEEGPHEQQAGAPSDSRTGLAEGKWPKFPALTGAQAVRIAYRGN